MSSAPHTNTQARDEVPWQRRDARIVHHAPVRSSSSSSRRVPGVLVAERHGHRHPEVFPWPARHRGARRLVARCGGADRRHDHRVGCRRRPPRRPGGICRRADLSARTSEGVVQQSGVVQHRRSRHPAAGQCVFHPVGRRHHRLDPRVVPAGSGDLQRWFRGGREPLPHPIVRGTSRWGRHRVWPGQFHARRRCVGRDHQVGWEDPACREDGHSRRLASRHRRVRRLQGDRRTQGSGARRRRIRHGSRRFRHSFGAVPECEQFGAGDRRVHAAVVDDAQWPLRAVTTGAAVRTVRARD